MYARLGLDKSKLEREVHRMIPRVLRSGKKYNEASLSRVSTLINEDVVNILSGYGGRGQSISGR